NRSRRRPRATLTPLRPCGGKTRSSPTCHAQPPERSAKISPRPARRFATVSSTTLCAELQTRCATSGKLRFAVGIELSEIDVLIGQCVQSNRSQERLDRPDPHKSVWGTPFI